MASTPSFGKVLNVGSMTADQIMSLISGYITSYFGDALSIYDQVSSSQTVYKVQVGSKSIPFYFSIIVTTGNVQISEIYRYWNATTHAGTGIIGTSYTFNIYNNKMYLFVSKNIFYIHRVASQYDTLDSNYGAGILLALPSYYPSVATTTTTAVIVGSNVEVPVDNVVNFRVGMKVAVADSTTAGWSYGTILSISSNSITITTLKINLAAGSFICVPPNVFVAITGRYLLFDEKTLTPDDILYCDTGHLTYTNTYPLLNSSVFKSDGITGEVVTSPLAWPSTFGDTYLDNNAVCACGESESLNDFLAKNNDASDTISGIAVSGDKTNIIDNSKIWTPSGLIGKYVAVSGGTNAGNCRKIIMNTATSITVDEEFPSTIDATSKYVIADSIYRYVDIYQTNVAVRESW